MRLKLLWFRALVFLGVVMVCGVSASALAGSVALMVTNRAWRCVFPHGLAMSCMVAVNG